MKFITYKEDSILNNSFVRRVNFVLMILCTFLVFGMIEETRIPIWLIVILVLGGVFLCGICIDKALTNTTFYEWDYTERKKKHRFTISYVIMCMLLCSILCISIANAYSFLVCPKEGWKIEGIIFASFLSFAPVLLLITNILNIISLYYPVFEDDITMAYKIQKKPDNWQDDGMEIKNDDEVKELFYRDFGVNM